jgi:hypothetical protein
MFNGGEKKIALSIQIKPHPNGEQGRLFFET